MFMGGGLGRGVGLGRLVRGVGIWGLVEVV